MSDQDAWARAAGKAAVTARTAWALTVADAVRARCLRGESGFTLQLRLDGKWRTLGAPFPNAADPLQWVLSRPSVQQLFDLLKA